MSNTPNLSVQALQDNMLQGWVCGVVTLLCSLLFSAFLYGVAYAFGKEGDVVPRRRWILFVGSGLMAFAVLSAVEHFYNSMIRSQIAYAQLNVLISKQLEVADKELEAIRNQTSEVASRGLKADILGVIKLVNQIKSATNASIAGTVSGVSDNELNSNIGSGIDMALILRIANSGMPATAWKWKVRLVLPDGKEIPASIPELVLKDGESIGILPTVAGNYDLVKNRNLLQAMSFEPLGSGASADLWTIIHVNGITKLPKNSHFIIGFEDVYGRLIKVDHTWDQEVQ